jgi:hypothetical protein
MIEFLSARLDEDDEAAPKHTEGCRLLDWGSEGWCDCGGRDRAAREVAAKRAIVASHQWHLDTAGRDFAYTRAGEASQAERHARHLAAVYADHPDYDEAWRP